MAAAASAAALAQAFQDASHAAAGLAAGGGVPVAQVQMAVQQAVQPLQAQMTAALAALQQSQAQATAQMTAALAALQAAVLRSEVTAAKAYNGGARDGAARPFVPVPNAAGLLAPAGPAGAPLAPLHSFADLRALNGAQLAAWCAHYGAAAPQALAQRRVSVAHALGAVPLANELEA
jgi:hypothetical protein